MTQPNLKNNGLLQFSSVRFGSVRVITPTCSICSSLSFLMKLYCHLWLVSDIDFLPFIFSPPSLLTLFYLSVCHFCLLFVVLLFWFDCSLRLFCAHFVHSSCVFFLLCLKPIVSWCISLQFASLAQLDERSSCNSIIRIEMEMDVTIRFLKVTMIF